MKLMILDGNSLLNRAYYGVRDLSTRDGVHTNAVFGFITMLQKLKSDEPADRICVSFDLPAPTFRHKRYSGYKATRKPMPEELAQQLPLIKEVLDAMGIRRLELSGYEADDIIGSVSRICKRDGWECVAVTGDRDSLQLIDGSTAVRLIVTRSGNSDTTRYDETVFKSEYGFEPCRLIDLKALMGDSSDNIPGVPGVGEKTARDLLGRFGSLDGVYNGFESSDLRDGIKKKLREGRDSAYLSYELATIDTGAPVDFSTNEPASVQDTEMLLDIFTRLEFFKLIEKLGLNSSAPAPVKMSEYIWQSIENPDDLMRLCEAADTVYFICPKSLSAIAVIVGEKAYTAVHADIGSAYMEFLRQFFISPVEKVSADIKSLMTVLMSEHIPFSGPWTDVTLAAYVLDPGRDGYSMEKCTAWRLGFSLPPASDFESEDAFDLLGGGKDAISAMEKYTEAVAALHADVLPLLSEQDMDKLYREIELPLCPVLADMENEGILIDRKSLVTFGDTLSLQIDTLEQSIYRYSGEKFNINSTKQLGELLFDKLMLPAGKKTKTGYSTNIDVLEKLRGKHPIIEDIIEYRELTKLKSTYTDGLARVIAPDGRIHTRFNMTATATGRLSSTEPNLQNIPVRKELGSGLRRMFVAGNGRLLADADYSQIELRLLAHISGDKAMQEAFLSGEDFHAVTASQVFGVPLSEVTSVQRSRAKAVNFGIVYGISDFSLSQDIGVSRIEARMYMENYLNKYPGVREYMKNVVEKARKDGYVTTLFGRRRYLPELKSSNFNVRSFGERVALNMPIQGTAADIMKLAMIRVHQRLKQEEPQSRLLLQIHDELIVEMPEDDANRVAGLLEDEMSSVCSLSIPLIAQAHTGKSWSDAK